MIRQRREQLLAKKKFARHLKRNATPMERRLWKGFKADDRLRHIMSRQRVILGYIADFYCDQAMLVIEVDGPIHDGQKEYDETRDRAMRSKDIGVLRFTNDQVRDSLEAVLARVRDEVVNRKAAVGTLRAQERSQRKRERMGAWMLPYVRPAKQDHGRVQHYQGAQLERAKRNREAELVAQGYVLNKEGKIVGRKAGSVAQLGERHRRH